jgi:hypothetical protein
MVAAATRLITTRDSDDQDGARTAADLRGTGACVASCLDARERMICAYTAVCRAFSPPGRTLTSNWLWL